MSWANDVCRSLELYALGIVPVRVVAVERIDGWCAYGLAKYMPDEHRRVYGYVGAVPWEIVRSNGDKLPEDEARKLFPELADTTYAL
jgi:hypothetical protein